MTSEIGDFREVFDATYPMVVAYVRRRVPDPAAADDIVAETFLVAWRRRGEVLAMDNALPWLYTVAANQIRNQSRGTNRQLRLVAKASADPTVVAPEAKLDPEPAADAAVVRLRSALDELSFDDQEVLRLVAWEELTYAETAQVLDCSVDAVGQRLRRAKQRLSRVLERHDPLADDDGEPHRARPVHPTSTAKVTQP